MKIDTDIFDNDQGYNALGVVAKIMPIGYYEVGAFAKVRIYRYLTFDCGKNVSFAAKFVEQAPVKIENGESFLDTSNLKPGQIVVSPGFIYEKIGWSSPLMTEHLKALKKYRPKDIITGEVDKAAGPVDLGEIKVPPNTTKQ